MATTVKTDEPLCVVAILKSGKGLEQRSIVFPNPDVAKSVSDWLHRNDVTNTLMSVRAYESLVVARNERELQLGKLAHDKPDLFGELGAQISWCPFCRKDHLGGATCMGHYP